MVRFARTVVLTTALGCTTTPTATSSLCWLSETQLNRSIADLYGFSEASWPELGPTCPRGHCATDDDAFVPYAVTPWPFEFPAELDHGGYEGMVEGQVASDLFVERLQAFAVHFAPYALAAPRFSQCGDWNSLDDDESAACVEQSVLRFAERAWRGPLNANERAHLTQLVQSFHTLSGLDAAATYAVETILQSPRFVFQIADASPTDLPGLAGLGLDYGRAERLALFLWNSLPDDLLLSAAATGQLRTEAQIRRQIHRMRKDPRYAARLVDMHTQWLELDRIWGTNPDYTVYQPIYWPNLRGDRPRPEWLIEDLWSSHLVAWRRGMVIEAELFFEATLTDPNEGRLRDLLTSERAFVTHLYEAEDHHPPPTWSLYGVDTATLSHEPVRVETVDDGLNYDYTLTVYEARFPEGQRAGALTLPATMVSTARAVAPSSVERGLLLLDKLVCAEIGAAPDGAAGTLDALEVDSPTLTNRERLTSLTASAACASCHSQINPAGFAFEHYDAMGGFQTHDTNHQTLHARGRLPLSDGTVLTFRDAVDLSHQLADQRLVHDCYTRQWLRIGLGRFENAADAELLAHLQQSFAEADGNVDALVAEVALRAVAGLALSPETP